MFFVCGLNGFLDFLPHPTEAMSAGAMHLVGGMVASGYFFPLLKGTEAAAGLLLLTNRFVPLALAVLAPIVINIVAFHAALAPSGAGVAGVVLVLQLFLAWAYRGEPGVARGDSALRRPQTGAARGIERVRAARNRSDSDRVAAAYLQLGRHDHAHRGCARGAGVQERGRTEGLDQLHLGADRCRRGIGEHQVGRA